jgi:hypothetical protein
MYRFLVDFVCVSSSTMAQPHFFQDGLGFLAVSSLSTVKEYHVNVLK